MNALKQLRVIWKSDFLSPKDLLVRAAVLGLLFLLVHLAGLRDFTSILNGTVGSTALGWEISALLGVGYILLYLGFVVLAPILVLAAGIVAGLDMLRRKPPAR